MHFLVVADLPQSERAIVDFLSERRKNHTWRTCTHHYDAPRYLTRESERRIDMVVTNYGQSTIYHAAWLAESMRELRITVPIVLLSHASISALSRTNPNFFSLFTAVAEHGNRDSLVSILHEKGYII